MFVSASLSGVLLSLLVTLGRPPSTLASAPPGGSVASQEGPWDTCYHFGQWRCGDKCVRQSELCECGNQTLRSELTPRHHCCTNTRCTQRGAKVLCPEGQVLDVSEPCEDGRCYSSYNTTLHLDYSKSRFSCSGQGTCLSISGMCQGLSSCGDSQVCDVVMRS